MTSRFTRKRLAIGAGVVAVAAAATGITVAAARGGSPSAAAPAAASSSTTSSSPAPQPGKPHRAGGGEMRLIKVTTVSATQLSGTDAKGQAVTFTIGPSTRVLGADGQTEAPASIPAGELVAVASGGRGPHARGQGSPSPGAGAGGAGAVAVVKDTGFRAA